MSVATRAIMLVSGLLYGMAVSQTALAQSPDVLMARAQAALESGDCGTFYRSTQALAEWAQGVSARMPNLARRVMDQTNALRRQDCPKKAGDPPPSTPAGTLVVPNFSIRIATDSAKLCTYGDGAGTPVTVPAGTPLIPGGPAAGAPPNAPASPTGPQVAGGSSAPSGTGPAAGPQAASPTGTTSRDCRVCGEAWPAGHPNEALCKTCGMAGSSAPDTPVCEHCGMDKPAGQAADVPCTTCGGSGSSVAAVPKDAECVVCGDNWPAGHPATASCPTCGMDGAPRVARDDVCKHCGMDKPAGQSAGAPCTVCGEGGAPPARSQAPAPAQSAASGAPVASAPPEESILDEIDDKGPAGPSLAPFTPATKEQATIDRQLDQIQQQFRSDTAARERAEELANRWGHDPRLTPSEWEESEWIVEHAYGAGGYFHGVGPDGLARLQQFQDKLDAADRDRAAAGLPALPKRSLIAELPPVGNRALGPMPTTSSPAPLAPQEVQVTVTIVFKADMAKVQEGQAALTSLPEVQLGKLLAEVPAAPGPAGTAATPVQQNAGAAADPSLCKSGADGACSTTVSYPYRDPPIIPGGPTGFLRLRPSDQCSNAPDGACTMTGDGLTRACSAEPGGGCAGVPPADGLGTMYYPYMEPGKTYTKPLDFKLDIQIPVADNSGGVIETTGSKTAPDLSLPAGTPAGVTVKATPFTSGDGRTFLRLALNQPFGLGFPFDTFFRARFGDKYKIDFCFDEAPMGPHAIASSALNSELPAAAISLRPQVRAGRAAR